jgi:hypothetical protein
MNTSQAASQQPPPPERVKTLMAYCHAREEKVVGSRGVVGISLRVQAVEKRLAI